MSSFAPERVFAALQAAGVDYVTVGGIAVMAHGVVRATIDVDLIPALEPENLQRLAEALQVLEARPYGEPQTPVTAELLERDANMRFDTSAGQVDVLACAAYGRLYPDLRARAELITMENGELIVVSRADLIRLKAATGRDRDLVDIGDLLALDE